MRAEDVIGEDGRVRVLASCCKTCIFRPGNPADLVPGRFEDVVRANLTAEALLTCHETLPGNESEIAPAVCAGYWVRYCRDVIAGRLAILIGVTRV